MQEQLSVWSSPSRSALTADLDKFHFLDYNGNPASAGAVVDGVTSADGRLGDYVSVTKLGYVYIKVSVPVIVGDPLTPDLTGLGTAKIAAGPDIIAGYSLEVGGAGDIILMVLIPTAVTAGILPVANEMWVKSSEFAWNDVSPKVVMAIPAGAIISDVICLVTEAFDGAAATLDIGNSTVPAQFIDNTKTTPATLGMDGLASQDRGVGLWDGTGDVLDYYPLVDDVEVAIVPGAGATAGKGFIFVKYAVLP
jgi:hypothetical protein